MSLRLALLGNGNIATVLADVIVRERNYSIIGTFGRNDDLPVPAEYDLLVEVAAPDAVATRVLPAVQRGARAIIVSIGALSDPALRLQLSRAWGSVFAATGAVGGLEHIRSLHEAGGVESASIESSKLPKTLIQPWMDDDLVKLLERGTKRVVLADGSAQEVAALFPRSANVAVAVALAADSWTQTTARMIADPEAINTKHVITASGPAGSARFEVVNTPSPQQPRSSAVVAYSVLRSIDTAAAFLAMGTERPGFVIPLV